MALASMSFTPVLKARDAEITALLAAPTSLLLTPLFELQNAPSASISATTGTTSRAKSSQTDASYFLDDVARRWTAPMYLDVSRVAVPGARGSWWMLLQALSAMSAATAQLMPVVAEHDPPPVRQAAAGLAAQLGRAALRLTLPHANPAGLGATMTAVASDLGLSPANVDVILDWGDKMEFQVVVLDDLVAHSSAVIAALGGAHGKLITIGTPNRAAFLQVGDWSSTRREWSLWLRLAHAGVDVTYGDYALYTPSDPVQATPRYGHLRYSSGENLHVHRRAIPATGGGLGAAFTSCCAFLVSQPYFLGAGFSPADQELYAIANGSGTSKTAGAWRRLAVQHHLAVVAGQLANPPAAPPPGTP